MSRSGGDQLFPPPFPAMNSRGKPPLVWRRLRRLRGWSQGDEEDLEERSARAAGARGADGIVPPGVASERSEGRGATPPPERSGAPLVVAVDRLVAAGVLRTDVDVAVAVPAVVEMTAWMAMRRTADPLRPR